MINRLCDRCWELLENEDVVSVTDKEGNDKEIHAGCQEETDRELV